MPIGALAMTVGDARVLHGFISDVRGVHVVRGEIALDVEQPELSGVAWRTSCAIGRERDSRRAAPRRTSAVAAAGVAKPGVGKGVLCTISVPN